MDFYPKIGVINGGISKQLKPWIIQATNFITAIDLNEEHGTYIGGLLVQGNSLNGSANCPEEDGSAIFDLAILPDKHRRKILFNKYYPHTDRDELNTRIFDKIDKEISKINVRFFIFSICFSEIDPNAYSYEAKMFDDLAEKHNSIFVFSAGNLNNNKRQEWPNSEKHALNILNKRKDDKIMKPAESIRNISVAALNPADSSHCIPHAPACYSRRGLGLNSIVKPDFAHVGGSCYINGDTGFWSIDTNGKNCQKCGTSYAAPLVAKTAAVIDHLTNGDLERETLLCLLYHNAKVPIEFSDPALVKAAKDFFGYGIPMAAKETLSAKPHLITLNFCDNSKQNERIQFLFNWPGSLVDDGQCKGYVKMTLVSSLPIDRKFGAELIRADLEAKLQQRNSEGGWTKRLDSGLESIQTEDARKESVRIGNGFKWNPVKVYEKSFDSGVGSSSEWRLVIENIVRDGEILPQDGVPFSALLTIEDINKEARVNAEMQNILSESGFGLSDIRNIR